MGWLSKHCESGIKASKASRVSTMFTSLGFGGSIIVHLTIAKKVLVYIQSRWLDEVYETTLSKPSIDRLNDIAIASDIGLGFNLFTQR